MKIDSKSNELRKQKVELREKRIKIQGIKWK